MARARVLVAGLVAALVVVALAVVVRSIGRSPAPIRPGTIDALATSGDACVTCHRKSTAGIVEQYGHSTMAGGRALPGPDLWTYVGAMVTLIVSGAVGAVLHLRVNLEPGGQLVAERMLQGAPLMAPLLFSNMGVVGLVALLPERVPAP